VLQREQAGEFLTMHKSPRVGGAAVVTSRRWGAGWGAVWFGMALLAACGHGDAANGADESHAGESGTSAVLGGAPSEVFAGGAGRGLDVAGEAGNGFDVAGGAGGGLAVAGGAGSGFPVAGDSGDSGDSGEGGVSMGGASASGGAAGADGGTGTRAGSIQLNDFGDYQVVQRMLGASMQRVQLGGTFTGSSIASVQAQVASFTAGTAVIVPWTDLLATSDGNYSGAIDVPQGGWYRIIVRGLDARGDEVTRAAGAHRWGVGMNVLCIGQSNMVGYGGDSYTTAVELAGLYGNDRTWKHLADPYDRGGTFGDADFDSGSGASLVPSLVNALSDAFPGLPIGVIPAAKGSSPLACAGSDPCWGRRNADDPADPSTLYGNSLTKARRAGGVELIVMHQGETDATNSTPTATYASELALLAQKYRADLGDVPLFMCQLGRSTTDISVKHRTDTSMQAIRVAQHQADDPPRVYLAATAIDLAVDGTDHYVKTTLDELGRRIGATIAYHYQAAGAPPAYRGPEIGSVSYADASRTVIDAHLKHRGGSDFSPVTGINGFVVLDDTAPVPLASVVRKNATTIRITLTTAIKGTGTVRYLYGKLPLQTLSNAVHDNSHLALPLEPTTRDLTPE
jgi:hypothetical protein